MSRVALPLGADFYQLDSKPLSSQRCINWIPTVSESNALSKIALLQPYGLSQFASVGGSSNRGAILAGETPYFVNGEALYSVSVDGNVANHGEIIGSGRVSMAVNAKNTDDGSQYIVIVVPDVCAYVFQTVENTLTKITNSNFRVASQVVFKDGYFVFSSADGSVFFNSNINEPLTYNALDFGTAEISPDKIVGLHVNHNELFVAGESTIELFQNVGGSGFPFQRIAGANIQKGVHAKFTMVEFDNTFLFVGGGLNEKPAIWRVSGSSSAQKISTNAIDSEIQKFTKDEIKNSFAITMSYAGQFLALFTFESTRIPSRTFVYNGTASRLLGKHVWFEMQTGVDDGRFRVQSIVAAYGELLVGDSETGIIGKIDSGALDFYGDDIFRSMTTSPFSQLGNSIFAGELEAVFESGIGNNEAENPIVTMEKSDDGGRTYSYKYQRGMGKSGDYIRRAVWRRQGRFPVSRAIRLTVTDKAKANLIGLFATPELGVN